MGGQQSGVRGHREAFLRLAGLLQRHTQRDTEKQAGWPTQRSPFPLSSYGQGGAGRCQAMPGEAWHVTAMKARYRDVPTPRGGRVAVRGQKRRARTGSKNRASPAHSGRGLSCQYQRSSCSISPAATTIPTLRFLGPRKNRTKKLRQKPMGEKIGNAADIINVSLFQILQHPSRAVLLVRPER